MIKHYNINLYGEEHCESYHSSREDFFDWLEEKLYILWELTPCYYDNWKVDLVRTNCCFFRYGRAKHLVVIDREHGNINVFNQEAFDND